MSDIKIEVEVLHNQAVTYAYLGSTRRVIPSITVRNDGPEETKGIEIRPRVTVESPLDEQVAEPWEGSSQALTPPTRLSDGPKVVWSRVTPVFNPRVMGTLAERVNAILRVEILSGDEVVWSQTYPLMLLAASEWMHDPQSYDALAAFVLPNSVAIRPIMDRARSILQERTGSSSTEGYQREGTDPEFPALRAYKIAEAIYDAIRESDLRYSNPPGAFENFVQRVRSPQTIISERAATCLDSTVLYAACLAQGGLDPVLFLVDGHAFAGFVTLKRAIGWAEVVVEDRMTMQKIIDARLVQPVETTTMCFGAKSLSFKEASASPAEYFGADIGKFNAMVVVSKAWKQGIAPPPTAAAGALEEVEGDHPGNRRDGSADFEAAWPDAFVDDSSYEYAPGKVKPEDRPPPRVRQWMNSLLDLSARNSLLRMKTRRSNGGDSPRFMEFTLPPTFLGSVDDALFAPKARLVISTPAELPADLKQSGVTEDDFVKFLKASKTPLMFPPYSELNELPRVVKAEIERASKGPLRSRLSDHDIERLVHANFQDDMAGALRERVSKIRASADDVLLSNGTNALFLALGVLSWNEQSAGRGGPASSTEFAAPIYLYPVLLEGGKGSPYTIRLDPNGSITPNYCLQEKLRRPPYHLELPELEFPESDDAGIDLNRMLLSLENKLKQSKNMQFAIQKRCVLGVFDYSTFRLWKDLQDHWKEMRDTSRVVKHVMYTPGQALVEDVPELSADAIEPYCPIESDDSQLEAIKWALEGRSFRLEGPPGTGKTQTITNLIASCLAHGKKILFVAEKQTALQQVKKRLHAIGLGDYCLELHAKGDSDARVRKNISEQVSGAINSVADPKNAQWDDLSEQVKREQEALDAYCTALHSLNTAELSLWKSREGMASLGDGPTQPVSRDFLSNYSQYWPTFRAVHFDLVRFAEIAGGLSDHPWRLADGLDFTLLDRSALVAALSELQPALEEFTAIAGAWPGLSALGNPLELASVGAAGQLQLSGFAMVPGALGRGAGGSTWRQSADRAHGTFAEVASRLAPHLAVLGNEFVNRQDLPAVAALQAEAAAAGFLSAGRKSKALQASLGGRALSANRKALVVTVGQALPLVAELHQAAQRIELEALVVLAADWWSSLAATAEALSSTIELITTIAKTEQSSAGRAVIEQMLSQPGPDQLLLRIVQRLLDAWERFSRIICVTPSGISRWQGPRPLVDALCESLPAWHKDRGENDRFLALQRWSDVVNCADRLQSCGLGLLRTGVLNGQIELEELSTAVERGLLKMSLEERLEVGNIENFDGRHHDRRIESFERSLSTLRELMKERIPGLITSRRKQFRLPNGKPIGEAADLLRELKPMRGEKTPIRTLLQKYGKALTDVMPCFMMSPDSVATLLPVGAVVFDLVIFDEASQVKTPSAIGALGRGSANIVVGDSKQMPPSSAFSSNSGSFVEDDPEDEDQAIDEPIEGSEEIESAAVAASMPDVPLFAAAARDVESILQEFEASQIPHLQLLCHYRSKDELLIAFSNSEIYEQPMLTFPSTVGMASTALEFRRLAGQFIRKNVLDADPTDPGKRYNYLRTNREEARAVVDEVLLRLRDPARRQRREAGKRNGDESIIVVTFNRPQMDLVKKLLEAADDPKDPVVAKAMTEEKDEETGVLVADPQLKIRNLETVQGDEAETVIFSVAFSKLAPGERKQDSNRVPLNFGPVTQDGGHRRLNVAVTRAQRKMIVFCSFDPSDMDVKATSNEGARLVQKFLMLAKNGPRQSGDLAIGGLRSKHIDDIAKAIENLGYRVQTQMGLSSLRVDLAVGLPETTDWAVAVMVDGPTWAERGSAFQREILPKNILRSLGWRHVMRIWLPSWIDEREAVIQRVKNLLDAVVNGQVIEAAGAEDAPPVPEPVEVADLEASAATRAAVGSEVDALLREPAHATAATTSSPRSSENAFVPFMPGPRGSATVLDSLNAASAQGVVRRVIAEVLTAEAPIMADRLGRLVGNCFGLGTVRQARVESIVALVPKNQIERTTFGNVVWATPAQKDSWSGYRIGNADGARKITDVPLAEIRNALVDLLTHTRSLVVEEATRSLANTFGFTKLGATVRSQIEVAILQLTKSGVIVRDADGRLRLP